MPNITNIPAPRVPLIDPKTGLMAREWYMFFFNLFTLSGSGGNSTTLEDVQKGLFGESLIVDAETNARNALNQLGTAPSDPQLGTLSAVNQDNVSYLRFSTGDLSSTAGTLSWNTADNAKTLDLIMQGGSVTQQIGEETYYRIKASSAITNGQVVMFTGSVGASGGLQGAPATGLTYLQSEQIMGVATENIAKNGWGYVTWFGEVRGINTTGGAEAWVDGDILYYNPAVTGGLTKTVPTAPNPKVVVAAVVHAATNGILFVRPTFGSALGQTDSNVQITSLANGDILQYKTSSSRWENVPASGVVVTTATNLSGGLANQIPYQSAPSTTTFIAAPTTSSFLQYNGSAFAWTATVPIANGGTGATSFAASGSVPYYSTAGSGSLVSSSGFTFDGTTLNVTFSAATTWAPNTEVSRFVTNNTSPTANSAAIFLAQVTYPVGLASTTGGVKFGAVASAAYSADFVVAPRNNSVYTEYWRLTSTGVVKQLYDASNYVTTTVASNGGVTFDAVGTSPSFTFSDATTFSSNITASVLTASKVVFTDASKKLTSTGTVGVDQGGTGSSSTPTNGQLLIGNGTNYTLSTLTAGSGVSITNSAGGISIAATGSGGTVTSVSGTGSVNGITLTGTVTTSGSLTLGGTLSGVDLTSQVTGILPLANGGTNANLTASNGGIFYSTATAGAILAGTATAGQLLQSGASAAPSWSTATYPSTTTANQLLYSSAANTVGGLTSANTAALVTSSSGVPSFTSGGTANRVLRTDGTTVSFAQVALATDVSGTLPVGNGGTGLTSYTANGVLYASATNTIATDSNFTYSATGGYLIQYSSNATWTPNTTLARVQTINTSATANSAALFLAQTTYSDSTTGGVKFGAVASASFSADFVMANRNAGTYQENLRMTYKGNLYGTSGATSMTDGFFYIPAAAGAPSGTPTAYAGRVPMYYDTTNNKFYIYNGAWKSVALT